jgi:hypothetical protein
MKAVTKNDWEACASFVHGEKYPTKIGDAEYNSIAGKWWLYESSPGHFAPLTIRVAVNLSGLQDASESELLAGVVKWESRPLFSQHCATRRDGCLVNRFTVTAILGVTLVYFAEGLLTPGARFVIFAITGLWYFPAGLVNDPFWFLRKRLWTTGQFWCRRDGVAESDPFIWSRAQVQPGMDVSHLLDD